MALVFRLWHVATVPPGLYVDEVLTARNALAWRLDPHASWLGSRPLLVAGWVETSNLYLAFASLLLRLGGDGLLGARLVSVVPSLLAVPLLFALGRELAGARVGALAALLLAGSHWAARSGRTGWDAVLMVTLQLGALACLTIALRRQRVTPALASGALLGLALFTYVAARLALLQAAIWLGWEAWRERREGTGEARAGRRLSALRLGAACLIVALAVGGPFVLHGLRAHPRTLSVRVRELSVLALRGPGEPWATLGRNVLAHAGMLHVRGGAYARDDLPGLPLLDPVAGVLLVAGIAVLLRGGPSRMRRLLVSWPLVMVLGGVLSTSGEGPPYPYRVLSLAPWACLLAALGGVALWDRLRARVAPAPAAALALALLAMGLAVDGWALFVAGPRYAHEESVYGTAPTVVGRWLAAHRAGRPALVLASALRLPPVPETGRDAYARANRADFYRPLDAIAAVQLTAGVYAARPARALEPLRPAGDVDLTAALPARLAAGTLVVLPATGWRAAASGHPLDGPVLLRSPRGTPVAVVAVAR